MKEDLVGFVNDSISRALRSFSSPYKGTCIAAECPNNAIAKGLCNAHYLRAKRGADINRPIQQSVSDCIECGNPTGGKGGWLRCAKHYKAKRQKVIKEALIEAMGGCCQHCGGQFPAAVYDFHHYGEKDADPSYLIANGSVDRIAEEISKCTILCANCHRIEHAR